MTADQNNSNTPQLMTEPLTLHCGHNAEVLRQYPDCHFDAIITDPPYGIEFLGKAWDNHTGAIETWQQCLRVLKPGGHLLAFSAARTYHHLATNIESTGFEIRDQLMWIYSSGFPKAQDIGRALDKRGITNQSHGWKTALKPGHEPIVMARRPMKGSTTDNVLQHGVGALNIDSSRIPYEDVADMKSAHVFTGTRTTGMDGYCEPTGTLDKTKETIVQGNVNGRYPSNVLGEITDYQKYFYCPKVSRRERHVGFEQSHIPTNSNGMMSRDAQGQLVNNYTANKPSVGNNHPTVKPVALMRYLIQLVTPKNSVVLDPFMGSGSTGMAARELGHTFVGIDLDPAYVRIAQKRITGWTQRNANPNTNLDHIPTNPDAKGMKTAYNDKDYRFKEKSSNSLTATDSEPTDLFDDLFE